MKQYIQEHFAISMHALIVAILLVATAWYVDTTTDEIDSQLTGRIQEYEASLRELTEITDRNGIDESAPKILQDCQRRQEFEDLLGRLGTLQKKDLILVQQLFESCGAFYAEQKALMVWRIDEIYTKLASDLVLLETVRDLTEEEKELRAWEQIVTLEKTRSEYLLEQASLQELIISALIASAPSVEISDLVREAQSVNESLIVIDQQIDDLRTTRLE